MVPDRRRSTVKPAATISATTSLTFSSPITNGWRSMRTFSMPCQRMRGTSSHSAPSMSMTRTVGRIRSISRLMSSRGTETAFAESDRRKSDDSVSLSSTIELDRAVALAEGGVGQGRLHAVERIGSVDDRNHRRVGLVGVNPVRADPEGGEGGEEPDAGADLHHRVRCLQQTIQTARFAAFIATFVDRIAKLGGQMRPQLELRPVHRDHRWSVAIVATSTWDIESLRRACFSPGGSYLSAGASGWRE